MIEKSLLILIQFAVALLGDSVKLSPGQKFYWRSPSYPENYESGSNFTKIFSTLDGGILNLKCVLKIPPTDRLKINLNGAGFDNNTMAIYGGPAKLEWNSTSSALSIGVESSTVSPGGLVSCLITVPQNDSVPESWNGSCGTRASPSDRIISGSVVPEFEIPWQVRLTIVGNDGQMLLCGGSIVSELWILTAAHCTFSAGKVYVTAGQYHRFMPGLEEQTRQASVIVHHENYDSNRLDNDIALIKLDSPLLFSDAVRPVCLPFNFTDKIFNGETCTVSGWGKTSNDGKLSPVLLKADLPVYGADQCRNFPWPYSEIITDNMICTYQLGKDSCRGDSGGPLTWTDPSSKRVVQFGLVSFGPRFCATANAPGVHAKVSNYLSWIETTTKQF